MIRTPLLAAALALGTGVAAVPAAAHQIWIEQQNGVAKAYFGEFGENLREASPGLLDRFTAINGVVASATGERPLTSVRQADGFALSAAAQKGESLAVEDGRYPILKRRNGDQETRVLWTPAARFVADFSKQAPKLALDVVPTGAAGAEGVQLAVFFKGQPLAKAKATVVAQSGWEREYVADEQGLFVVSLPWLGPYVVEVSHADKTPGTRDGEAYDSANYAVALTLVQTDGLPGPAAPAARPPNKPKQ